MTNTKYKIYCKQRNCYFADEVMFDTLKDVRIQLISYHSADCNERSLKKQSLADIANDFEWEIQDEEGNEINYKLLEKIK